MRNFVVLISLILFSSSFSLIYQNFTSNGTCILYGEYLPINSKYFIIDGRTFVKLNKTDTLISYLYGIQGGNSSIFDWYTNNLYSKNITKGTLFVNLKENCSFSIGNHVINYSNNTLKVDNDILSNNTIDLLNITFSNGNFTIFNKTYTGSIVNINNLTNFYISNFSGECKNTSQVSTYSKSLSYRDFLTNNTEFLLTFPMKQNEFLIDNDIISNFTPNDHIIIKGLSYNINWTYACSTSFTEVSLLNNLIPYSSFFLSLQVLNGTTAAFIYNWENCSNLVYQRFILGQKNEDFNLSYENGTVFINTLMKLGNMKKKIFKLMNVNETNKYKLYYPNTTITICNETNCVKENGNSDELAEVKPNKQYVFTNDIIKLNISDNVSFMNKTLSVNPIIYNTSNNCNGSIQFIKNNSYYLSLSGMRNYQNCSFDLNISYHIKNKTSKYEIPISVDEPQIKLSCNSYSCKYTINSSSQPHITAKENNKQIYYSNKRSGEFSVSPGEVFITYGNLAGDKEKTIEIKSESSNPSSGSSNSGSGISNPGSLPSTTKTNSTGNNSSNVSNSSIKLSNETNIFNHSVNSVKVSGITGKFIDVNSKRLPWATWVAISLIFALFIILKFYRKVERRIIE